MIVRKVKQQFTVIPQEILDEQISLGALGLLCWMLSKPDNWEFNRVQMCSQFGISEKRLQALVNELKTLGYVQVVKYSSGYGSIKSQMIVCESKIRTVENTLDEKYMPRKIHAMKNTSSEKSTDITNTDFITNTEYITNTEVYKKDKKSFADKKIEEQIEIVKSYGVEESLATEYVDHRIKTMKIKPPLTHRVMDLLVTEKNKAGISIEDAIRIVIESQWRGFRAEYIHRHTFGNKNSTQARYDAFADNGDLGYDGVIIEMGDLK